MYHRYVFYKIYLGENLKLEMPFTWQLFEHQKMALPRMVVYSGSLSIPFICHQLMSRLNRLLKLMFVLFLFF